MKPSGWCATDLPHPTDHARCQARIDKGEFACGCERHEGHTTKEENA